MNKNSKVNRGIRKEEEIRADLDQMQEKTKSDMPEDESYYDALIKKRIGEALRSEDRSEKLDVEVLHAWVAADRRKRAIRRRRYAAVCACILLVCCGTFGMKMMTDSDDYYAVAGKNDPVTSEKDGNTVIKNNGEGVDNTIGEQEVVIENWEHVADAKKLYPELLIPEYVPEGYEFEELNIRNTEIVCNFSYRYSCNEDELFIIQAVGGEQKAIKNYSYTINLTDGTSILMKNDVQKAGYYIISENNILSIKAEIDDQEYIKIINSMF